MSRKPRESKKKHTRVLYIGFDETNHLDKYNEEVRVAIFSPFEKDIYLRQLPKQRPFHHGLPNKHYSEPLEQICADMDYAFLTARIEDHHRLRGDFTTFTTASLLQDMPYENFKEVHLFFDGKMDFPERKNVIKVVSNLCDIDPEIIKVRAGKDFDRKYPIVNLADSLAYWLFYVNKLNTLEQLSQDPHRRRLIFP